MERVSDCILRVGLEEGTRQVHPPPTRKMLAPPRRPPGMGLESRLAPGLLGTLPFPVGVLRPQQGSMLPVCLSRRARPAQPEGGGEALVAGSCPALPWGLGSWKGCWEEPWAPSHHSPRFWLWRECLTPRGQSGQPMALPRPELPWVFIWPGLGPACCSSVAGTLYSCLPAVLAPRKKGGAEPWLGRQLLS